MELRRRTATAILRRSIHTFLQHYTFFTTTAALLALPFSVSILLSQTLPFSATSFLSTIHTRLDALFDAAGFPPSSQFFTVLCLKLSQTISSFSLTLPFSLTFLLISKSAVIVFLLSPPLISLSSVFSAYRPLLATFVCNSLIILSANATAFSFLFLAFNSLKGFAVFENPNFTLFMSATAAVVYSIFIAHALVISNFAVILSGKERIGGYFAILKACVMIQGAIPTALSLAIPMNVAMAAVEALFQYRVVRAYRVEKEPRLGTAMEGLFIAYLYSIIIVIDTIVSCIFFKSCKLESAECLLNHRNGYHCRIDIPEQPDQKQLFEPES